VRLLWTAPLDARETLRFSGGLVASDGEADVAGDGVTLFAHALPPAGAGPAPASEITGGCSVARHPAHPGSATAVLAALALRLRARRRRRAQETSAWAWT
jgi:hypothetical protein